MTDAETGKSIEITRDEARALLAEVVAEKGGDYVYPRANMSDSDGNSALCVYFEPDGSPSCIVGHLLARKGITLSTLGDDSNQVGVSSLVDDGILACDKITADALYEAQASQDGGDTWGEALADAERVFAKESA